MKNEIYPCIWYDGKAMEAASYYTSIFSHSGILDQNAMVTTFHIHGRKIMALNGGPMFKINPSISLFIYSPTIEEINKIWAQLIQDGSTLMEIGQYPWAERYGWLRDKFGLTWQIMINKDLKETTLMPSLLFTSQHFGKAENAITTYTKLFTDSSILTKSLYPAGDTSEGKVLYSEFKLGPYEFSAMDGPGTHEFSFNEAVSIVVNCETQEEIDYYWENLTSNGGEESQCGWCKDAFGISWQIVPAKLGKWMSNPETGQKIMEAFLKMKKFDIGVLERIANG